MSHAELLFQKFAKAGIQGAQPPGGVWGVPKYSFSFFCAPPAATREERKKLWGHPTPRQRAAARGHPAWEAD